jgi:hypothetical protein
MTEITRRNMLALTLMVPATGIAIGAIVSREASADTPSPHPGPKFFVKGIYQQPAEFMARWKARGVNTIFTINDGADLKQWTAQAIAQGLYMVRVPAGIDNDYVLTDRDAFERDVANPYLLALALMDEPSNLKQGGQGITYDDVSSTPAHVDAVAKVLSAGGKPLWINHVGNHINNVYLEAIMSDYADSPYIDWMAQDSYPISVGTDLVFDLDDCASTPQGHAIDRLMRWSNGKPQFSFVGLTKFDAASGRDTTPAELQAQAWSSIIHGAVGIIYFSFMFSPQFSYDATPENLQKELALLHTEIDEIEHILVDKQKGGRRPYTLLKSIRTAEMPPTGGLPFPFEACATKTDAGEYKIVQNLSAEPAELTYQPWGLDKVMFQPYECKRGFAASDFTQS